MVILDNLRSCLAALGDLVDVGTFQQAQAEIGAAEVVDQTSVALAVELVPTIGHGAIELLLVILREYKIIRLGVVPLHQPA